MKFCPPCKGERNEVARGFNPPALRATHLIRGATHPALRAATSLCQGEEKGWLG